DLFDARDAPLRVKADEAEVLRVESDRTPAGHALLRVARHEVDGKIETDDDVIEEAEVDLTRSLERVVDERARRARNHHAVRIDRHPDVLVGAEEIVSVVDDEAEA